MKLLNISNKNKENCFSRKQGFKALFLLGLEIKDKKSLLYR